MAQPVLNDGRLHGPCTGYGAVNQCGTICWISLVLAKRCGVTNPEIEQAIRRGHDYIAFYVGRSSIPYGDMVILDLGDHDDNGKNSAAACGFSIHGDKAGARFFSRMTVASHEVREKGHTGNYFSFLWGPLGAARAGPEACSAFLHEQSWIFDLERRRDGGFTYQGKPGVGYGRDEKTGRQKNGAEHQYPGWDTTGARILMYCLPRKVLYITGRDGHAADLTSKEVADTIAAVRAPGGMTAFATKYDDRTVGELTDLLGSWSPVVRQCAAMSLARKPGDHTAGLIRLLRCVDGECRAFVVRAVLRKLTLEEMQPLWPAAILALENQSPSFVMRANESREAIAEILAENRIEEGIDLLVYYLGHQKWHGSGPRAAKLTDLLMRYGAEARRAIPGLEQHLRHLEDVGKAGDDRQWDARTQMPVIRKAIEDIGKLTEKPKLTSISAFINGWREGRTPSDPAVPFVAPGRRRGP